MVNASTNSTLTKRLYGRMVALKEFEVLQNIILTAVHTSFCYISDSSSFHNVSDNELLNSFVLGNTPSTVSTPHRVHMSTSVLGTAAVSSFARLKKETTTIVTKTDQIQQSKIIKR